VRRRSDLLVAVGLAVLCHVGLAAGAAWMARQRPIMPAFEFGESAVQLTLVATPPAQPVAPPPVPRQPDPPEPLPLLDPEPLPVSEPPEEEPVEDPPAPVLESVVPAQPAVEEMDADMQDKGVEASAISSAAVRPRYPLGARLRGEEGLVRLAVRVDATGKAEEVEVVESSGFTALDRAAVKAAWKAHYIAADGRAHAGETVFGVRFRLEE
jgi:protein TonB